VDATEAVAQDTVAFGNQGPIDWIMRQGFRRSEPATRLPRTSIPMNLCMQGSCWSLPARPRTCCYPLVRRAARRHRFCAQTSLGSVFDFDFDFRNRFSEIPCSATKFDIPASWFRARPVIRDERRGPRAVQWL